MPIKVCVAGATGWTGRAVVKALCKSSQFKIVGAVARQSVGEDIGALLGLGANGVTIRSNFDESGANKPDVLVDFTKPDSVKQRVISAVQNKIHTVIGTSGLTQADYQEIDKLARANGVGVIAAGNFSVTAALAKHFSLLAAKYLPHCEIIDYAHDDKPDAPSGTTLELAEAIGGVRPTAVKIAIEKTFGRKETRGATINTTQVHSVRLPGYVIAFESIFGLSNERLTIRHDAGSSADPYVTGTLLAIEKVVSTVGLIRGLDKLLL